MTQHSLTQAVITEDSDLLVYGCRRVFFKMDDNGNGKEIQSGHIGADLGAAGVDFSGWPRDKFRQLCVLSGCDYVDSLDGVGIKTAYKLLRKHGDAERVCVCCVSRVLK